jgi:hypothetical protein
VQRNLGSCGELADDGVDSDSDTGSRAVKWSGVDGQPDVRRRGVAMIDHPAEGYPE